MDEDTRELRAGTVESDAALAQKGTGMHRTMAVAEARRRFDARQIAFERRQPAKHLPRQYFVTQL